MRRVSRRASRVAPLFAVFLVLGAAGAWAGETQTPPVDPPQARLNPPGGAPVQMSLTDMILIWLQSRLGV
jgi:hypothetical protein